MSNVNIPAIIRNRNLPYDQFGKKTFDELKKEGLPSSVSALSCPRPFKNAYGREEIELLELPLGTDNVTHPAFKYFSLEEKGGLDLENAYIDGNNIPFDSRNRSLDIPNGRFSNTIFENIPNLKISGSHTLTRHADLDPIGLQVRNVGELEFSGEGALMNHLKDIELTDVKNTHAENLHFGDIKTTRSPIKLNKSMGFTVTSDAPNVTLIPPLGSESTVRKVFIEDQK